MWVRIMINKALAEKNRFLDRIGTVNENSLQRLMLIYANKYMNLFLK